MNESLDVWFGDDRVGALGRDDRGQFRFAYEPDWQRFPISLTLPITNVEYVGGVAHAFFANLLPEGGARQAVCARLGISVDNDFALLRAIGGECAGALSIGGTAHAVSEPRYEPLSGKRLQALVGVGATPLLVGGSTTRLSLAGAQDKVPVALRGASVVIPLAGAPSTHILKLPSRQYAHLPANEAFSLGLARRIGFEVVDATLFRSTKPASLLVVRYDRVPTESPVRRLHQEDLCQALGLPPTRKYEQEDGPTFARVVATIRSAVSRPLIDVPRLLRWQAFNVVVGNADGHAKNLSILYADDGARLAPFYDILSTRHYAGIDRNLAMSVGGRRNPDELGRAEWTKLAADLGIGPRVVIEMVAGVAQDTLDALATWTTEFTEANGRQSILETLPTAIRKRARRVLRKLQS